MTADTDVVIRLELVELDEGHWCRTCAMSSGVRLTFSTQAYGGPGRWSPVRLRTIHRCHECGGDDVEPRP